MALLGEKYRVISFDFIICRPNIFWSKKDWRERWNEMGGGWNCCTKILACSSGCNTVNQHIYMNEIWWKLDYYGFEFLSTIWRNNKLIRARQPLRCTYPGKKTVCLSGQENGVLNRARERCTYSGMRRMCISGQENGVLIRARERFAYQGKRTVYISGQKNGILIRAKEWCTFPGKRTVYLSGQKNTVYLSGQDSAREHGVFIWARQGGNYSLHQCVQECLPHCTI